MTTSLSTTALVEEFQKIMDIRDMDSPTVSESREYFKKVDKILPDVEKTLLTLTKQLEVAMKALETISRIDDPLAIEALSTIRSLSSDDDE